MGEKSDAPTYSLLLFFFFWYAGNVKYNEYNKAALDSVGGKTAGMTMTVSTMQLGVCAVYALLIWIIRLNPIKLCGLQAPDKQAFPKSKMGDIIKTLPVGFCSAAAHSSSVFALGGDPLFGQIVKAGEPVISAVVNTIFYGKPPTMLKALCLPIIVGGVAFASLKKGADGAYALKFDQTALLFGMMANGFAAFKGSENKKLMDDKDLKSRFGGVGNQFAVTEVLAFIWSLPVMFAVEGDKFSEFVDIFLTNKACMFNVTASGLTFYLYNELATMTVKAVGPVGSSVANTAKRVIVMLYMAAVTGKALTEEQQIGAAVAIGGVMLYSVIDNIFAGKSKKN
mmetsp:Transcript_12301/g.25888  ORF Transcript_12301/g.25888 Transcript_12301/m.25888 type:complete len:339 (-) Transcript_12301:309-1325(-)|eukprot:CAMPEP_0182527262 /NCGR_PEP_ID=MMETSP1323-20130603/3729_1 /TAXON_ID=236787 /ORGANISM="Florenciella parvula, Strain RCC1693" /LENGTH=338 /DNA_ID=CAMNT_0024736227 /DNA_START=49 /DNA_END=1065 /DNA_ORIENTATION=-